MANYAVDQALLAPFLPAGTELDSWQGTCYVSLVGFMFLNTRIKGIPVPFHTNFEEINLRFYVRRKEGQEWRRGVVFIKEIVPRPALAFVANKIYKENYETMPTAHTWLLDKDPMEIEYRWKKKGWHKLHLTASPEPVLIEKESEHEFITEHYWGYTQLSPSLTSQYEVTHPQWLTYPVIHYTIDVNFGLVYGERFAFLSQQQPRSVLLAEGSQIAVKAGSRLLHAPDPLPK